MLWRAMSLTQQMINFSQKHRVIANILNIKGLQVSIVMKQFFLSVMNILISIFTLNVWFKGSMDV